MKHAEYEGEDELPIIQPVNELPSRLIRFSESVSTKDFDQWVHFYEHDCKFTVVWDNPRKYLPKLKKFRGVITPDFSLYRDMPLVMQKWNIYRSRALGHWWQSQGLKVLPNVRYGDERTYSFCCNGVPANATICISSYGCLKDPTNRVMFRKGLRFVSGHLKPSCIVVYDGIPDDVFSCCTDAGIKLVHFAGGWRKKVSA